MSTTYMVPSIIWSDIKYHKPNINSVIAQEKVVKQHFTQRNTRNFFRTGTKTGFANYEITS